MEKEQKIIALSLNRINTRILEYTERLATVAQDPDDIHAELDVFIQELNELRNGI